MLEHGGNLQQAAQRYGRPLADWLDLSTGINPQGYPLPALPASAWQRLPETDGRLERVAAEYYGADNVLVTAGSQAIIQTLPRLRPPCRVRVLAPMYAEHAHAWRQHGHEVSALDTLPDESELAATDVLLLCNPNNPTGRVIAPETLQHWHQVLAARGGWLVVDEAFMDASPELSLAAASSQPGLIVLRSLGKFFGLAGARVGFLLADQTLMQRCGELLGPWPVSGPARMVAAAALADHGWQQQTRQTLQQQAAQLNALLQQHGLPVSGSTALFSWVPTPQAVNLHSQLAAQGVWLRLFTDTPALRFGLPPAKSWARLAEALSALKS